jgi:A/G-specific adenine glycosylase
MAKGPARPELTQTSRSRRNRFQFFAVPPRIDTLGAVNARPSGRLKVSRILQARLLAWYEGARRDLPWRTTSDPYAIWVSETMLQQTRVETVIPYYKRFLQQLPTISALAEAPAGQVLALWSGLGYYRRARMLQAAAKRIEREYAGSLPGDPDELRRLEGVGAYTAGAVASIAFGRRAAVVDGNVTRVLARLFAIEQDVKRARGRARVWRLAEQLAADGDGDPGAWNQALMELGATVCVPRDPKCGSCPVGRQCQARARGIVAQLPRTTPKRPPTAIRRVAIVLASTRAVLLARRRADGLFGGLWEPPSAEGEMGALAARLGLDECALAPIGEVVHVLSHRRMRVEVARGPLVRRRRWPLPGPEYDAVELVTIDRLGERGQGALTRKILAMANVVAGGLRSDK